VSYCVTFYSFSETIRKFYKKTYGKTAEIAPPPKNSTTSCTLSLGLFENRILLTTAMMFHYTRDVRHSRRECTNTMVEFLGDLRTDAI